METNKKPTTAFRSVPHLASTQLFVECPNNQRDSDHFSIFYSGLQSKSLCEDSSSSISLHHKHTSIILVALLPFPVLLHISRISPSPSCAGRLCWKQTVQPSWRRRWHSTGRLTGWSAHTECAAGDGRTPAVKETSTSCQHMVLKRILNR